MLHIVWRIEPIRMKLAKLSHRGEDVLSSNSSDNERHPYADVTHIPDVPGTVLADTDSDSNNSSNSDSDDNFADEGPGHSYRSLHLRQIAIVK